MGWQYNPFTGELDRVGLSAAGSSPWNLINATALASSTTTIDTVSNANFESIKYHVVSYNSVESRFKTFEINILNNNGSYRESISHKIGSFSFDVNTVNNAGSLELQIVNPNAFEITFKLGRLILI
jgi:hypothetical protein